MRANRIIFLLFLVASAATGQNLGELATTNDDYSVVTEPSADKALIDFALVPPYRSYDIDHPPGTCGVCDEFTGDDDQLTWRWGNQGSSTITYEQDLAHLSPEVNAGTHLRVRWTTGPDGSAGDWVVTAKYSNVCTAVGWGNGLILLVAGDETTPTSLYACSHEFQGGGAALGYRNITVSIWSNYTTFSSNPTQHLRVTRKWGFSYLRMRYVSSTKGFYCGISDDGVQWLETTVQTLAAHPTTSMGFYSQQVTVSNDTWVWWFRALSDATGTTTPYPAGE